MLPVTPEDVPAVRATIAVIQDFLADLSTNDPATALRDALLAVGISNQNADVIVGLSGGGNSVLVPKAASVLFLSQGSLRRPKSFGAHIRDVPKTDGIPTVISHCIEIIVKAEGFRVVGLFNTASPQEEIARLMEEADLNNGVLKSFNYATIHTVANLIKEYFRMLPEPLIPVAFRASLLQSQDEPSYSLKRSGLKSASQHLSHPCLGTLLALVRLLDRVGQLCEFNHMTNSMLASIFAPLLFWSDETARDVGVTEPRAVACLEMMLQDTEDIFPGYKSM